jgi:hypothetical protein
MTMMMHKAEKINPNVCCHAGRVIAIAQATSITRTKTAACPTRGTLLPLHKRLLARLMILET